MYICIFVLFLWLATSLLIGHINKEGLNWITLLIWSEKQLLQMYYLKLSHRLDTHEKYTSYSYLLRFFFKKMLHLFFIRYFQISLLCTVSKGEYGLIFLSE
jgi:hypothetical protein